MCPYDRCSKTLGRARIAPKRKPTAARSSSATRQRRSQCPMWPRVKRRQSTFHPEASDTPPRQGRRGSSRASPTSARGHRDPRRGRLGCERSEEHTSELQSLRHLVCRLLLEKKKATVHELSRDSPEASD